MLYVNHQENCTKVHTDLVLSSAETINRQFDYSVVMMLFNLLTRYSIIRYQCSQMDGAYLQTWDCEKSGMLTLKYFIL